MEDDHYDSKRVLSAIQYLILISCKPIRSGWNVELETLKERRREDGKSNQNAYHHSV
jgi:hypothetical protein